MEGELWVGMVGNRSFLISLNRWNTEREKRFKLSIMSLWFQFIPISKKKKQNKTKQKKTNKQTKWFICLFGSHLLLLNPWNIQPERMDIFAFSLFNLKHPKGNGIEFPLLSFFFSHSLPYTFYSPLLPNFQLQPYSISIWDAKKTLFYNLKTYFIYFIISFYNFSNIPVSKFKYNLIK